MSDLNVYSGDPNCNKQTSCVSCFVGVRHFLRESCPANCDTLISMSSSDFTPADGELVSALSVVEGQPLDTRADGYTKLYEDLRAQLEGGDIPSRD